MFILKQSLYFRCPDSGRDIHVRELDEMNPEDMRLIRKLSASEERFVDFPEFARQF